MKKTGEIEVFGERKSMGIWLLKVVLIHFLFSRHIYGFAELILIYSPPHLRFYRTNPNVIFSSYSLINNVSLVKTNGYFKILRVN